MYFRSSSEYIEPELERGKTLNHACSFTFIALYMYCQGLKITCTYMYKLFVGAHPFIDLTGLEM